MIEVVQKTDKVLVLALSGTLDMGRESRLKEDLVKNIVLDSTRVVLDFRRVEFIDSACLGTLISLLRKLRKKGGDVCVVRPSEEVLSIFQITRLDKVFKIFDNPEEALASFAS